MFENFSEGSTIKGQIHNCSQHNEKADLQFGINLPPLNRVSPIRKLFITGFQKNIMKKEYFPQLCTMAVAFRYIKMT